MVFCFLTNHNVYQFISNMGKNLTPYNIVIGDENIYFLTAHFKFIGRDKVDYDDLLSRNENSADPFDYHVSNSGKDSFKKLRLCKIQSD